MKTLAQSPTHISAFATVLLITKTFTMKYYDRRISINTASIIIILNETATTTEMNKIAVKTNWSEKGKNEIKYPPPPPTHTHTHK